MMPSAQADFFLKREQFRMRRLEVFHWGTFHGRHEVPIAERGFLFTGKSGSGKTTLLDAFSALLVPPKWVDFNAAAREADRRGRDRNLASYVRGAWADQPDGETGEIVTRYLRTGATWSAIALTFQKASGETVVLCRIFWLRGNASGNTDVRLHFIVANRPFELKELDDFDLDVRKLKQGLPDVDHFDKFSSYAERFQRLLGIENELALRLLHKTQSAKNLGELNSFLREFMLEQPRTFDAAKTLVSEFAELRDAHHAVVTARRQVETLAPARKAHQRHESLQEERRFLEELRNGLDLYRDERRAELLKERSFVLGIELERNEAALATRQELLGQARQEQGLLEERHRGLGGDKIESLEEQRRQHAAQRTDRLRRLELVRGACKALEHPVPETPEAFAELAGSLRREQETRVERAEALREQLLLQREGLRSLTMEFQETKREIDMMRRQPSNIPAHMLELRHDIARALGLEDEALPFAGELIEVRAEEAEWRGAIERVLHSFALSMLVDEANYPRLSNHVNETRLTGRRLVYHRAVRPGVTITRTMEADSLVRKVNVKAPHKEWIEEELRQGFDYTCVNSMQAFRKATMAVTREGQVRHGKTRHEKDDRTDINDRRRWVLGFSNLEKLGIYERQAQELAVRISELQQVKSATETEARNLDERAQHLAAIANLQWLDIDVASSAAMVDAIERQLAEIRQGSAALREIAMQLEAQRTKVATLEEAIAELRAAILGARSALEKVNAQLAELRARAPRVGLSSKQRAALDARMAEGELWPDLDSLDRCINTLQSRIHDETRKLDAERNALVRRIEETFGEFKRQWPNESADMMASMDGAPDFLALLDRLELDGLPAHEQRFFDLLQTQSHQNLVALDTHLKTARNEIRERMEWVNAGLSKVPFNPGTSLQIRDTDRHLPEVQDFKRELQNLKQHAWTDDKETAERQFMLLNQLVHRLGSAEAEHARWRETVLDVRQHVEFVGNEFNDDGDIVEVYRSGAGKSGGQRQKLTTTCLAAALRYQLGSKEHEQPMYAPVVLDEAFDKADNEFTELAMNIFESFGFQMIVATPLKSVMTLEPFIGGACFVHIGERRHSGIMLIEYDEERKRLSLPEHTRHAAASNA